MFLMYRTDTACMYQDLNLFEKSGWRQQRQAPPPPSAEERAAAASMLAAGVKGEDLKGWDHVM